MAGRLRFRHLQLVAALQASGSLRAAADQLHQTQPALSKALKEIEDIFGFPLFERSARGVRATEQGRVVIRGAAPLLAELAHLQDEAIEARGAAALLRVGATPFVALSLLPQVFNRLLQRVPPVHPRLTEESAPRLHRALLAGELDALVSTYSSEPIELEGGARLRYEKLYDVDIAVIAPKRHPLAGVRRATWGQLAVERWILPPRSASLRRMIEERFLRRDCTARACARIDQSVRQREVRRGGFGPRGSAGAGRARGLAFRCREARPGLAADPASTGRAGRSQ